MLDTLKEYVNAGIDGLQKKWPPNRVVAVLLVVLTAPAAALGAYLAVWVPAHFPGLPAFTSGQYTAFGLAGAGTVLLAAVTAAYRFIDGVQIHQLAVMRMAESEAQRQHELKLAIAKSDNPHYVADVLGVDTGGSAKQPTPEPVHHTTGMPIPPPGGATLPGGDAS